MVRAHGRHAVVTWRRHDRSMSGDVAGWWMAAFFGAGWLVHRLLRTLERRGWLYYLGLDLDR